MSILAIDHVNIGTPKLEASIAFFRDVLGLTVGWRPDFPFPGAWLYAGGAAVVHLVGLEDAKGPSKDAALDHFAFRIDDYGAAMDRLAKAGVNFTPVEVPGGGIRQLFIRDLNGVNIELNYREPDRP